MQTIGHGLREAALTLAYNAIVIGRSGLRRLLRPTELGVRVLVTHGEALLLVRHRGGHTPWSLPGGGINRGESLVAAAVREVREEGGCAVQVEQMLGFYHQITNGMSNHVAVFVCTALEPARPPIGDLEIVDAHFFLPHEFPAATDAGSLRRIAEFRNAEAAIYRSW